MEWVIGIHNERMVAGDLSVPAHLAHDPVEFSDGLRSDDSSFEQGAQGAGVLIDLTGLELSPVV